MFALSFCGFDQDYLAWFCCTPVLWAMAHPTTRTARQATLLAWAMGFVAHMGVYTWLVGMLRDFGYLPWPVAVVVYALVCAIQSSLFALWGYCTWQAQHRFKLDPMWGAPLFLLLSEWAVPALFPSYLANSQYRRIVLLQGCEWYGVLGLSYVLALSSSVAWAVLAWASGRRPRFPVMGVSAIGCILAGLLAFGFGAVARLDDAIAHAPKRLRVGLVQANMGIYEKTEFPEEGLRRHRDQSLEAEQAGAQLIVWPESGYYFALDPGVKNVKHEVLGRLATPLLFGGMRIDQGVHGRELFNSAFLTDGSGNLRYSYDKTHLLAFGEYLPLGEQLPWMYKLSPQTSLFTRGRHVRPMLFDGMRLGVLICYEDILPNFVRHAMSESPDILINLTNDAWFGKSHEPRIHLALATFRAVEQRRFLVRATNTGISAIIDPAGRVLQETPVFARANIVGDVVPLHYVTLYQRYGDWPVAAALLVLLSVVVRDYWQRIKARRQAPVRS